MSSSSARYRPVPDRDTTENMDFAGSASQRIARRPVPQPPTSTGIVSPVSPHAEPGISAFPPPAMDYTPDFDRVDSNRNTLHSDKIVASPDTDGSDASKLVAQPTGADKIYVPHEYTQYYAKAASASVSDGMQPVTNTSSREKIQNPGIPWGEDAGLIPVGNKDKRKRMWMTIGAIALVLIIVGAVLGGVLGSRAKGGKDESSSAPLDTPTPSASATVESILAAASIPSPKPSPSSSLCPTEMGFCTDGTCAGQNGVEGKNGTCMEGLLKGCPCKSVCSPANESGPCDFMNCAGINNPLSGLGICTGGQWWGCYCVSVCGTGIGSCNSNGCQGKDEQCTTGRYRGCRCYDPATRTTLSTARTRTTTEGPTSTVQSFAG